MARAADLMVDQLAGLGIDRIFCVPGESYLALLDALHEDQRIDVVVCRQEGGAGFAAMADGKMTGRVGVAAVSRGPGATNVSIAIHNAQQDAVPLLVLIGQVARHERGRKAFQEVDYAKTFSDMAKGVWEVHDAAKLPETLARAVQVAESGTPGPVVVALPEDMLVDETNAACVPRLNVPRVTPGPGDIDAVMALLETSQRPLVIAGGAAASHTASAALSRAAAAHHLPVALTFKQQHIFDNGCALYAGHLGFKIPQVHVDLLAEADLIIAVGTRLGDAPTQCYTLPKAPQPDQPLVHVYPGADAIGCTFQTDIGLPADPAAFLTALAERNAHVSDARRAWAEKLNRFVRKIADYVPASYDDGLDFGGVVQRLAEFAPRNAIVTMDAGNFSSWIHRVWPWDGTQISLGSVGGAMGLGVPAGVAASLRHPDKTVLAFCGDGGVMMTGNELATAVAHGAKPKIIVSNNGSYGTIRQHQERDFPTRVSATGLVNPDFAAWGRSFGALGLSIRHDAETAGVVAEVLRYDGPAVVDVKTSVEAISAFTTVSKLRQA